jgi:hypothetical protein
VGATGLIGAFRGAVCLNVLQLGPAWAWAWTWAERDKTRLRWRLGRGQKGTRRIPGAMAASSKPLHMRVGSERAVVECTKVGRLEQGNSATSR